MKLIIYPIAFLSGVYLSLNFLYKFSDYEKQKQFSRHIEKVVQVQWNAQSPESCSVKKIKDGKNITISYCSTSC